MKKAVKVGFFDAIISSICYGLYPLFAILLYNTGSSVANSLFYRYAIAFLIYLYILKVHRKIDLAVSLKEFFVLFFVGVTFAISSIALFVALKYIDSGIACTIVFVYPVIVAFIMTLFFHEKLTTTTIVSTPFNKPCFNAFSQFCLELLDSFSNSIDSNTWFGTLYPTCVLIISDSIPFINGYKL